MLCKKAERWSTAINELGGSSLAQYLQQLKTSKVFSHSLLSLLGFMESKTMGI